MLKKIALFFLILVFLFVGGVFLYMQGLSDLRTEYVKKHGFSVEAQKKGRHLLTKSLEQMGGVKLWKQYRKKTVRVTFTDSWYGFLPKTFFMPLEFSGQKMKMLFRPEQENSRLTFLDGKRKNSSWGIQKWTTYRVGAKGTITWKADDTIKFYLPTYQYFFYMPFYLAEAEKIVYAGEKKLHGKLYDLVLATWGKLEPQDKIDQYLIWISRENARIDFVQYTVRDVIKRIVGTSHLTDYRKAEGLLLPHNQKILNSIHNLDDVGHHIKIKSVLFVKGDVSKQILPDPARSAHK